ncbi:MAG: extracellular solute-binding protein [Sarcina sp.]
MKKLIGAIVLIFIIITTISCVAISKKTNSNNNELEKSILVYTTESNAKMQFIAEQFKKSTGITVNYKVVNNLNEALESAKNNGTNVDVVYGGNKSEFISMTKEGLLTKTPVTFSADFNSEYTNKEGYWYGTSLEPMVMFYNKSYMLPKDVPSEFYQLALPQYYNRIVLPDTSNFTVESLLGALGYQYTQSQVPTEYDTFLQGLRDNVLSYQSNESEIFNAMKTNKEAAISVGELDQVNAAIQGGAPFTIINAKSGSPMIMQGVGAVKNSANENSAKLFIEFVAGPNMQLQLADKFNSIPTLNEALNYAPKWMLNENGLNIANINWEWVSQNTASTLTKFNSLVKAPKVQKIVLQEPVIKDTLIPSQQAKIDKTKVDKKAEETKVLAETKKAQAATKAKQEQAKVSAMQKSALQGLQSLGETNS